MSTDEEENPFAPPEAPIAAEPSEKRGSSAVIEDLKRESTLRLILLGIVTLNIYQAYYMREQAIVLNRHVDGDQKISDGLVNVLLGLATLKVLLTFAILAGDGSTMNIEMASNIIGLVVYILSLVWAFKMRNRINRLMGNLKTDKHWFHGFWTYFWNVLYINYKVNCIHEAHSR